MITCPFPLCHQEFPTQHDTDEHVLAATRASDPAHEWPRDDSGHYIDPWPGDEDPPEAYANGPAAEGATGDGEPEAQRSGEG